jgi:hypothetical protein
MIEISMVIRCMGGDKILSIEIDLQVESEKSLEIPYYSAIVRRTVGERFSYIVTGGVYQEWQREEVAKNEGNR